MSKKNLTKIAIMLLTIVFSNILIFKYANLKDMNLNLSYAVISDKEDFYQTFFSDGISELSEDNSQKINYISSGKEQNLKFKIPTNTKKIRFDIGNKISNIVIHDIKFSYLGKDFQLDYGKFQGDNNLSDIESIRLENKKIYIVTSGEDPYITYNLSDEEVFELLKHKNNVNFALKIALCFIVDILLYMVIKKSKSVLILVQDLYNSKTLIWNLAKNDFKTKYVGSYLGIIWALIQPVVTLMVYWIVFEFGLKAGSPTEGVPFMLWFSCGLIPWFFFSEAVNNATNCLFEYGYLVKKVVFKISVLPIIKIISSLFVHFVFIGFIVLLSWLYGFYPTQYMIQLSYYVFCTFFMILAISYSTSAIVLFFRDLGQIINILLQIGMWATPIMWSYTIVPEKYQWIVKLNPMYYIVEGYRDTFINHIWFFNKYFQTIYFWIITVGIFGIGALMFKKLKPHFADVL